MSAHELIVGGQRSGKSRQAERLALRWQAGGGQVAVVATALAADAEMQARIQHHRANRPAGFDTIEAPLALCDALGAADAAGRLIVVDCLTLWLTNWLMPMQAAPDHAGWQRERSALLALLPRLASPVVFVSNEVGWGVSPLGREVRDFVDELGRLNQDVARLCGRLTLVVAGQAWTRPVEDSDV
ncbi:MAG: bifunctional adenosylcobinamide kinase/adenosylcobinamide-phosphate guanylyltransferase [Roseateles sp.]|jgi:adenosylcobinamide kinase/adenosylcobinamide-phosphate guanylyltransferase|nr:bifunctional adenosylcobinamide kinase/adenosylcobinamide-phosphate guanylyltransferase [Methylibium sp.]MBY0368906.1 bifunctional adenosylcobinamide kinase/adenosylcobinamide-phosphate guanylyltransferase [Burkholderiaceae bacterium]|mmetsp:Transcript_26229/g.61995  ORF Transcript_26229/g.61995 Transcript_26229/m.61995 type:complete len:185 (+) Transcript_26229:1541-2095(+)